MASYKPVTDLALARLYKAVGGVLPYDVPVSESMETERLKSIVIHEIETFKEDAKILRLAAALDVQPRGLPAPTDSQLLRLYAAVR
jgi:hypothetical protein